MKHLEKAQLRIQLFKLLYISLFWFIVAISQFLFEYEVLLNHQNKPDGFSFWKALFLKLGGAFIGALSGGSLMVFYLEDWFRKRPYGQALLFVFFFYTLIFLIISFLGYWFFDNDTSRHLKAKLPFPPFNLFWWNLGFLKNYFLWLMVTFISIIALFINDKYGPGVLKDFLLGKYFRPKKEDRIFMFLDLRGSMRIAEKLGEERYFYFLKEVFRDATLPILNKSGEIYQYVGDEIIVTWKLEKGLKNANCVRCFFEIQEVFLKKQLYYWENYKIKPKFKAGLHAGTVMTGEIGTVKRDISFLGDVINTTSRIEEKCNDFGVDILLSKYLVDHLSLPPNTLQPKKMEDLYLRGKRDRIALYTI